MPKNVMVQEQLNTLIQLQQLDSEIYRLKAEKAEKPSLKDALKAEFARKDQGLKDKQQALNAVQLKRKEYEMNLQTKESEVKKYQTQLLQVKTNREYMSLQKEIAGLKADNAVIEDDILALMEKTDTVKEEIAAEKENLAGEEKRLKAETERIDQETKDIEAGIASLQQKRNDIVPAVEKTLLARYERILKAKQGLALVPIKGEFCGGCNRVVTAQIINEARMKEKIITCGSCARLLYWPD